MLCASVPTAEVLALTAELQQLGGGDVAVGRAWAGAALGAAAASAAAPAQQLDAAADDWAGLKAALSAELHPWLQRGFGAAAMLLGGNASAAAAVACSAYAAAGGRLGISWQLLDGGAVRDALGRRQQQHGSGGSRRQAAAPRPASRLGTREAAGLAAASGNDGDTGLPCTALACTAAELEQLLDVAVQQVQAATDAAAASGGPHPPPALLLHLSLLPGSGGAASALRVLHLPASQNAAAEEQREALLRMLREAADLHVRRREGEHLLASAKLSSLNQLAAPLLAGSARLFLAADLSGEGSGNGSAGGSGRSAQGLLPLLASLRHMQAVCSKCSPAASTGKAAAAAAAPDSWLPTQQFLQQLEQRRLAEQQRKAEAAALAAAEADRRARLQQAARQRQEAAQATPAAEEQQQAEAQGGPEAQRQGGMAAYRPSTYLSSAKPAKPAAQQQQASEPAARAAIAAPAGSQQGSAAAQPTGPNHPATTPVEAGLASSTDSLQQLRQQFQSLYSLAVGEGTVSPPAAAPAAAAAAAPAAAVPPQPSKDAADQHRTIAAGVAAADDIAVHVAALRRQAAAEARLALEAQQQLLGGGQPAANGGGAAGEPAGWAAAGRYAGQGGGSSSEGGSADGGSRPSSGGGLALQLEDELLLLQHQAAQAAAGAAADAAGDSPQADSFVGLSSADLASLADLDGTAPSLGALYAQPASRGSSRQEGRQHERGDSWEERPRPAGAAVADERARQWQQAAHLGGGTPQSRPLAASPLLFSPSAAAAAQSDVFKSENLPLWSLPPAGMAAAQEHAPGSGSVGPPAAACNSSSWRDDYSSNAGASEPGSQPRSGSSQLQRGQQPASGHCGSYAAAWRRQDPSGRPSAAASPASSVCRAQRPPSQQSEPPLQPAASSSALVAAPSGVTAGSLQQLSEPQQSELESAQVADLLEELQREQRINSALLQQLHEVQRQLEEAAAMAAAAVAAQQPPAPGVQDPADFNGLLAALQLERQQCAALRQRAQLQAQQAEEAQLALEARLHTQQRQLLVAAARRVWCRAWEQGTPLATLFRRYEEDLQRLAAERGRLEEESGQLARLLAAADLERLAGAAQHLPEEPAAVCREHQRKLAQAQAQVRKLEQDRAALSKRLQDAERRDRLAELCRRQAESGAKAAAELRRQLAAREQQLEAQSLAAAAAAGEAERLRQRLQERDEQLGRALADRAELVDTVDSLRQQVAVLKGQLGRDRVLRSMQA